MTQQNAALVEEAAAAAESMEEEAESLSEAVSVFKLGDGALVEPQQYKTLSTSTSAKQDLPELERRKISRHKSLPEKSGEKENEWKEF